MTALPSDRRRQLENTVQEARDVAETAARAALDRLAVAESRAWDHLSAPQKELRNRLRAHARQLGDVRKANGEQAVERLVTEVAYQQWHRMLFARFLAENHLLIHPDLGVPVTLEECEELAADEGAADGWELAGRFAARMLPQIFRPDEPALALGFTPEHQRGLEQLLDGVPAETFTASDSLGWVYQFWQSKRKKAVNDSGVKIGADELPAVTQLFTEPYMVKFLLHNTLGAWWVGRHPGEEPPVEMEYLHYLDDGTPAAGTFGGWPKRACALTVLDPCCGSGHFLVAAFAILVAFRMHEEGLSAREACDAVLRDNLFGLELDERCTQIAGFALALAAWTYPGAGGYRPLPEMNIACSGLAVGAKREEWLALANGDERLRQGMGRLYDLFKDAPTLGSLIDPRRGSGGDLFSAEFSELQPLLERALEREKSTGDYAGAEIGIAAQGIATAAELLSRRYTLVATNVPYLAHAKQAEVLREFAAQRYPTAYYDLATVFVSRAIEYCSKHGTLSVVCPENWLFLKSYKELRRNLLRSCTWNLVAKLGPRAFQTPMWDFNIALSVVSHSGPSASACISGVDVSNQQTIADKERQLPLAVVSRANQVRQYGNPDHIVTLDDIQATAFLSQYAASVQGFSPGDTGRITRRFWEVPELGRTWYKLLSTPSHGSRYSGRSLIISDPDLAVSDFHIPGFRYCGQQAWGKRGMLVGKMGDLPSAFYCGEYFDANAHAVVPDDPAHLEALCSYIMSPQYALEVRRLNRKLAVDAGSLTKIPFDLDHWTRVAEEQYPDGLPKPYSDDPTQWLFKGEVTDTTEPLQVAMARLLGYRWPDQEPDALDELADDDGIVCLPPVRGEAPAADRLRALLARAYGGAWSGAKERALLEQAGAKSRTLEEWLRNEFFEQHYKLFHHRPFLWQIWDGTRGGFSAVVNYHQLDRRRLELLTYTYLGDWIRRQEHEQRQGKSGADERLVKARELQKNLELILAGEPPYDLFVRWKGLEEHPIGWEPDLNDGVRMNIYPFMKAGLLRKNPNVKWGKDRGSNPAGAPWGPERFNRYEDLPDEYKIKDAQGRVVPHLTNAVRRAARAEAGMTAD